MGTAALVEYLTQLPESVPPGKILVHNQVRPARVLGMRGFRAWLASPDNKRYEICRCAWAPQLGTHYHVRRVFANFATKPRKAKSGGRPRKGK